MVSVGRLLTHLLSHLLKPVVPRVYQDMEDLIRADAEAHEEGWHAILCPSPPVRLQLLAGQALHNTPLA